jgi:hypothetical protein
VKLVEVKGDSFVFDIEKREKTLLLRVLRQYPLISSPYERLSKTSRPRAGSQDSQGLLEEALAEQRAANKAQLEAMLAEKGRFIETRDGYRFSLTGAQIDWLLQVLNDIRVGSWMILGSPNPKKGKPRKLNVKTIPYLWTMEVCGGLQMALLQALEQR